MLAFEDHHKYIKNVYCYILRHYGNNGLSVLIYRQPTADQVVVLCGDWYGNNIDLTDDTDLASIAASFVKDHVSNFINLMRLIKLDQAQYFFSITDNDVQLVDTQISQNKFVGPGMIRDVFGGIIKTQEVLKIETIDDRAIEYIKDGSGTYAGDIIIKPTRFRLFNDTSDNSYHPMYVQLVR